MSLLVVPHRIAVLLVLVSVMVELERAVALVERDRVSERLVAQ
jgi:hypothetical protein